MQTPFSEGLNRLWKGSMWHVDSMRTSLIATGNGGTEPTRAALTLFYDDGKKFYTIEKVLQPGQQIWADVGAIIRNQIPDTYGNVIPTDVAMGSYELRDMDHYTVGLLYEGKLVIDKTWGHGYYGCANCCGYRSTSQSPNPFICGVGCGTNDNVAATDCSSFNYDVTAYAINWGSDNTAVATVANAYTNNVGVGDANASSNVWLNGISLRSCPQKYFAQLSPVKGGKTIDLVGTNCSTNPNITYGASWGDLNNLPNCGLSDTYPVPSGGSCVNEGTSPKGTPLVCYRLITNNGACVTDWCASYTRLTDAGCTKFLDTKIVTVYKVPTGCSPY